VSSNVGQNYPYSSETEPERLAAVQATFDRFDGLRDKVAAETTPLGEVGPEENGAPARWWIWVCPTDDFSGRLHVAGYPRERHGLYTVCDTHGDTYLR
jgi:hypothetical protein